MKSVETEPALNLKDWPSRDCPQDCEGPQDEGEGAEGHDEQLAGILPEDHRIGG